MSTSTAITPVARSWRDIHQNIAPRAMSNEGRKRLMIATMKTVVTLLVLCVCAWGAYEVFQLWEQNPTKLRAPVKGEPVRNVTLRTDGVLDQAWLTTTLALPKNISLMELDLNALRERLLANGQVRTVLLTRKFPDTLAVVIEERLPVARIKVQVGENKPEIFLVARDGVVFPGICQQEKVIETMPYLDGVPLKRTRTGGFVPIDGMGLVADLLGTAHGNVPDLYRSWTIISLARLASDGEIIVRSTQVPQIIFGLREDFYRQLAQLDLILDEQRHSGGLCPALRSVNLAVGGNQVPVAFDGIVPPAETKNSSSTPVFFQGPRPETQPVRTAPRRPNVFTNLQRTSNRDV